LDPLEFQPDLNLQLGITCYKLWEQLIIKTLLIQPANYVTRQNGFAHNVLDPLGRILYIAFLFPWTSCYCQDIWYVIVFLLTSIQWSNTKRKNIRWHTKLLQEGFKAIVVPDYKCSRSCCIHDIRTITFGSRDTYQGFYNVRLLM
jgi:hypothetical protein